MHPLQSSTLNSFLSFRGRLGGARDLTKNSSLLTVENVITFVLKSLPIYDCPSPHYFTSSKIPAQDGDVRSRLISFQNYRWLYKENKNIYQIAGMISEVKSVKDIFDRAVRAVGSGLAHSGGGGVWLL